MEIVCTGEVKLIAFWSLTVQFSVLCVITFVDFDATIIFSRFVRRIFYFCCRASQTRFTKPEEKNLLTLHSTTNS